MYASRTITAPFSGSSAGPSPPRAAAPTGESAGKQRREAQKPDTAPQSSRQVPLTVTGSVCVCISHSHKHTHTGHVNKTPQRFPNLHRTSFNPNRSIKDHLRAHMGTLGFSSQRSQTVCAGHSSLIGMSMKCSLKVPL